MQIRRKTSSFLPIVKKSHIFWKRDKLWWCPRKLCSDSAQWVVFCFYFWKGVIFEIYSLFRLLLRLFVLKFQRIISWNFNPTMGWNFKPTMGWNFKKFIIHWNCKTNKRKSRRNKLKCDRVNQNKRNNQKICEKVKFDKDINWLGTSFSWYQSQK